MSAAPTGRQGYRLSGLALLEFQLQLTHRQRAVARRNMALIQRDFHHRPAQPQQSAQANNVAAVNQHQGRKGIIGFELECAANAVACRFMLVARQIEERRSLHAQRHVVLQPLQWAAAGCLGGLHPVSAFLAQAHNHTLGGQQAIRRVEVACLQALLRGLATLHGGFGPFEAGGRNFKFKFEFVHGGPDVEADSAILRLAAHAAGHHP